MKRVILLLLLLCCSTNVQATDWQPPNGLPKEFFIQERWFALTRTFDLESDTLKLGSVVKKFFSVTPSYTFYDVHGEELAKARSRFFAIRTIVDVTDANDVPLGMVEEQFSWLRPRFRIINRDGLILANARLNFWGTKFTFSHPMNEEIVIAELSRPFFNWFKPSWTWTMRIEDEYHALFTGDDALLFTLVAVYQTDKERHRQHVQQMDEMLLRRQPIDLDMPIPKLNEERLVLMHSLLEILDAYCCCYGDVELEEKDIAFVEDYVDTLMAERYEDDVVIMDGGCDLLTPQEVADREGELRLERLIMTLETLLPLLKFDDENLSFGQKSALYYMLQSYVEQSCPCS